MKTARKNIRVAIKNAISYIHCMGLEEAIKDIERVAMQEIERIKGDKK